MIYMLDVCVYNTYIYIYNDNDSFIYLIRGTEKNAKVLCLHIVGTKEMQ